MRNSTVFTALDRKEKKFRVLGQRRNRCSVCTEQGHWLSTSALHPHSTERSARDCGGGKCVIILRRHTIWESTWYMTGRHGGIGRNRHDQTVEYRGELEGGRKVDVAVFSSAAEGMCFPNTRLFNFK
ncbi:hypothetical protein TNCV_5058691 [Trichonephila clavipes]|nr:hypothetical protein TNCV_5058691 [Trichonephila clavipes]